MAKKHLNKIFLSASIPSEDRDEKYFQTADVFAIRDSVRALATVVIPRSILVWGGHPAITPLIHYVMRRMDSSIKDHITLYQSRYFEKFFPKDNAFFENVHIIPAEKDKEHSLKAMRVEMITQNEFKAGIFIGGMEGVEVEFSMFKEAHPNALILPVASTGAAAKIIFESLEPKLSNRLTNDYAYMALFRSILKEFI